MVCAVFDGRSADGASERRPVTTLPVVQYEFCAASHDKSSAYPNPPWTRKREPTVLRPGFRRRLLSFGIMIGLSIPGVYSGAKADQVEISFQIIDEGIPGHRPETSVDSAADPAFKSFIASVSNDMLSKARDAAFCHRNSKTHELELTFIRRPLILSVAASVGLPLPLDSRPPGDGRFLGSPWLKLLVTESPRCQVRAIFQWSERQLLLDQALMSGARAQIDISMEPFTQSLYESFMQDYEDNVLNVPISQKERGLSVISERVPPELLWLYVYASQNEFAPFFDSADEALRSTTLRAAAGYPNLMRILVNSFVESLESVIIYTGILDIEQLTRIQNYRIER
jgi:hypothetical protein